MILTILVFLLILTVLVLIHEAGHFFVAKKLKIKVEEFGFGLPPRAFGIKHGETTYSINWLPIGGFVKLYGEDDAGGGKLNLTQEDVSQKTKGNDVERAFYARPAWQRALVVVAGVVMNLLLAIVIFYIFLAQTHFKTSLPLLDPQVKFWGAQQRVYNLNEHDLVVSAIANNSPAALAQIHPPSLLLTSQGKKITDRKSFTEFVTTHKGQPLSLTWMDMETGEIHKGSIIPRVHPPKDEGSLGIAFFPMLFIDYATPGEKIFSGITHPFNLMVYNFDLFGKLIALSVQKHTTEPISQSVAGPVGVGAIVGSCLDLPLIQDKINCSLNVAGVLSLSLAIFNILPIPALDGGRLFFILIELVFRKKVNQKFEGYAHTIGMTILMLLIAVVSIKDLFQYVVPVFLK